MLRVDTQSRGRRFATGRVRFRKIFCELISNRFRCSSDADSNKIYVYDGQGTKDPQHVFDKLHRKPVTIVKYNPVFDTTISVDKSGILEYWTGPKMNYGFPKCARFDSKLDTDLYEFAKHEKAMPISLCVAPNGGRFATISLDRKVRVFNFLTGKLLRVLDESLPRFTELQQATQQLPNMEFGRRYNQVAFLKPFC